MKNGRILFSKLLAALAFVALVFMVASCGGGDGGGDTGDDGGETPDTTSPVPGGGGTITVVSEGQTIVSISWTEATDDVSMQGSLEYIVYFAESSGITSVEDAVNSGTQSGDWTAGVSSREVSGLTRGTAYWFNVFVRDDAGNIGAYTPVSGSTLTGAPLGRAGGIDFTDLDMGHLEIAGYVEIQKAEDESDMTEYLLYWGDEDAKKLTGEDPIAEIEKTGEDILYFLEPDTAIPDGAEYLLVFTANDLAEMEQGTSVELADEEGNIYANTEGIPGAPIFLEAGFGGADYEKTIGTGRSYYYTERTSDSLSVELKDMTDDVDIICYDEDDSFQTENTDLVDTYGRTAEEMCGANGDILYFVIDGSDTGYKLNGPGASFTVVATSSPVSMAMLHNEGTEEEPADIPTGYLYGGQVGTDGTSYYRAEVTPGVVYTVNVYSVEPELAGIYTDQFITEASSPVTATGDGLYISVPGDYDFINLEVVYAEGEEVPVFLITGKSNKCRVNHTSSYYVFDADEGTDYAVTLSDMTNDLDVFVYSDMDFSDRIGKAETENDPETCSVTAESGMLAVRVDDVTGNGGTFILTVEEE